MRARGFAAGSQAIGATTLSLAALITSYFYTLPLGRYAVSGIQSDLRIYDFVFVIFLIAAGQSVVPGIRQLARLRIGYWRWGFILIGLVWASLLITYWTKPSIIAPAVLRAGRFTAYMIAGAAVPVVCNTPRRYRFILNVIWINIVIQAILGTLQGLHILDSFWPSYWLQNYGVRPVGTLSPHHKQIGVVMLLGTGITTAKLRTTKSLPWRIVYFGVIGLTILVPLLAGSRTAFLGLGAFMLAYLIQHKLSGVGAFAITAVVLSGMFYFAKDILEEPIEQQIRGRITDRVDKLGYEGLYGERTVIYFSEIPRAVATNPIILITGTGFQNVSSVIHATGAHNNYLHAWLELGIVGFLVYMRFLHRIVTTLGQAARRCSTQLERLIAADVWVSFMAVLATMLVGESLWAQYSMFTLTAQILAVVGLAVAPLNWAPPKGAAKPASSGVGEEARLV